MYFFIPSGMSEMGVITIVMLGGIGAMAADTSTLALGDGIGSVQWVHSSIRIYVVSYSHDYL